jgi:hypothetical protein
LHAVLSVGFERPAEEAAELGYAELAASYADDPDEAA